jgi:hypothetical protein
MKETRTRNSEIQGSFTAFKIDDIAGTSRGMGTMTRDDDVSNLARCLSQDEADVAPEEVLKRFRRVWWGCMLASFQSERLRRVRGCGPFPCRAISKKGKGGMRTARS